MLTSLYLRDFAIVSEVEFALAGGLTVVSGETGAGKSLVVDALLLLCGARADAAMVRHGAARAELAAGFDLDQAPAATAWLESNELDGEPGACQLRRVVRADGGSRAWINGRPVTIGQLAGLGGLLVEVHGQNEHQALLQRDHQLQLLDAFGDHAALLDRVRSHAVEWQRLDRRLRELASAGDPAEQLEYLAHQLGELEAEALEPDAIDALHAAHRRLANASTLIEGCARAQSTLSGDDGPSPAATVRGLQAELARLADDEPALADVAGLLDAAAVQIDEAGASLTRIQDRLELDPAALEQFEMRLTRLHELARKHRVGLADLLGRREAIRSELDALRDADAGAEALQARQADALAAWREAAAELGRARAATAERLAAAVAELMPGLGMQGGRFEIELQPTAGERPDPLGAERIEFMVSANPGMPPRPLRKVASGGELSRISLAIAVATLDHDGVATMVFDEVDAGIGGGVAEVVGQRLRALGARRQVLCVTHLAQVAAQGHAHLRVEKASGREGTSASVHELDPAARVEELARMLGGVEITRETRAHARQMLRHGSR